MGNQLLASKIVVVEEQPRIRNVPQLPTAIPAFVGVTEKGPVGEATLVTSFEEYANIFGGHVANSDMAASVEGFFTNGGAQLYVVRTVHYTDVTSPATKTSAQASHTLATDAIAATAGAITGSNAAPFALTSGDTVIVKVDGGADQTATFTGTAASRESGAGTFNLDDAMTLTVAIDGGAVQTITFLTSEFSNIDAATAAEVAAVINGKIYGAKATVTSGGTKVTITSDKKGTASGVNVTGGTANAVLGFTTGNTAGGGNVANIAAVQAAEAVSVIDAATSGCTVANVGGYISITSATTGASSSVQVTAPSSADDELGFDNAVHTGSTAGTFNTLQVKGKYDGAYANDLRVKVADATSGDTDRFNLQVLDSAGLVLETWPNLSMDDADSRYVETVVNDVAAGSTRISVVDLDAATSTPRPVNGTFGPLTGGGDGLSGLVDNDFIGSQAGATGIYALDVVNDLTILAIPGKATSAVHNAMVAYCEVARAGQVFAILDPPAGQSATAIVTYVETTAGLGGLTEHAAIYWPRIKVLNPDTAVYGTDERVTLPPSGYIAGVYSRTDNARPGGIYDPPAGTETGKLFGVLELETSDALDENKRDLVFPKRINPITTFPGSPIFIDGARTLKGDGNFPTVAERRGVSYIERSIKAGLQFARHKNNTPTLRGTLYRICQAFLLQQMRLGAFRSEDPTTAFFVDFGDALNPPSQPNIVTGRIGLATAKPAEYIVLRFSQDTRAVEAELAG